MGPNWHSIYFSGNGAMVVDVVAERAMVPWWWHLWKLRYYSNGSLSSVWAVGLLRMLLKELDLGKRNKLYFEVACFWPSDLLIAMCLSSVLKWEEMGGFIMGGEPDPFSLTTQKKNSFWDVMTISDILHIQSIKPSYGLSEHESMIYIKEGIYCITCCPRGVFKETRKFPHGGGLPCNFFGKFLSLLWLLATIIF